MVRCSDGSLYTGITTDIDRRVKEHNRTKRGAAYTRARRPVVLAFLEKTTNQSTATLREIEIKRLTRKKKQAMSLAWQANL